MKVDPRPGRARLPVLLSLALSLFPAAHGLAENLVVYTPHPTDFVDAIVREFEIETGIRVSIVSAGTGELLRRMAEEAGRPGGDVMWGGSRASLEGYRQLFEPYRSANAAAINPLWLDPDDAYTPFTAVPTVIMYNRNLVPEASAPESWADLLAPSFKGRIAFADPGYSSSSLEALSNMLFAMGKGRPDEGWLYVEAFVRNLDHKLLSGSQAVYRGVAEGEFAIGVTFEEPAATYQRQGAPVGIAYPVEGTIVEPDGVAVIKGARNRGGARLFVDFATSRKVQERMAGSLNRRSCRIDVAGAACLPALSSIRVIAGDYRWASSRREALVARFRALAGR